MTDKEFVCSCNKAFEYSKVFFNHFGYFCELPYTAIINLGKDAVAEFKNIIDKSITDNYDYTIEKYGTIPLPKGDSDDILID